MSNNIKDFNQFINESIGDARIYLIEKGTDGFGNVVNIHLRTTKKKIGSIVYRQKKYLADKGFPVILELHMGFDPDYQRQGFFQDTLIELYDKKNIPIYISKGRVINDDVFKAIEKLDKNLLNVETLDNGYIITKQTI